VLLLLTVTTAFVSLLQGCIDPRRDSAPIVVGIGDSDEQKVLGAITILVLERAGFRPEARRDLGAPWMVRKAIEGGSVDLVWDYTGRVWTDELGHDQVLTNAADLYRRLREADEPNGLTWVDYAPAENRNVMLAPESWAAAKNVRSFTDLAYHLNNLDPDLVLCVSTALSGSAYGQSGFSRVYGAKFKVPNTRELADSAAIAGLRDGSCHCALVPASSIPPNATDLRWLWDDKDLMPASNLAPVARYTVMRSFPDLAPYLRRLSQALDNDTLALLLQQVRNGTKPERVARQFLRSHDVVSTPTPTPTPTRTATPSPVEAKPTLESTPFTN